VTVLDPILTDSGIGYGPLASDTGSDVFGFYEDWRRSDGDRGEFLSILLRKWEIEDAGWEELDEARIDNALQETRRGQLTREAFQMLTRDDAIIAFAFAQIILDGNLRFEDQRYAQVAVQRQKLERVMKFRGWREPLEREHALTLMEKALSAANII